MADGRDFRKLDMATQAELRRVAVAMVAAGKTRLETAAAVGVNRRYVGEWVAAAARAGTAALAGGRRGRRPGEQKALSQRQEARLRRLIAERCPDQLKLPFALWTREAVGALIARETGVRLWPVADLRSPAATVGRYLRAWGFTAQRPTQRASERREPLIRAWLERDYPATGPHRGKPRWDPGRGARQGGGLRDPLGRRDRAVEPGELRSQLRPARPDTGDPAAGCAGHAVDDLQPDQPGQAALHGLFGLPSRERDGDP
jgi:transposase